MAQDNLNIIRTLNLILEGKIDDSKLKGLDKELTNVLQATLQRLPGGTAIIKKDLKIDPNLDIKDLNKQINSKLQEIYKAGEKKPQILQTKEFLAAEQSVLKFTSALEKMAQVQSSAKFPKSFTDQIEKAAAGQLDVGKINRQQLEKYKAYLQELSSTWAQIQREFGKVKDVRNVFREVTVDGGTKEVQLTSANIGAKLVADLRKSNNALQESVKQVDGLLKQRDQHIRDLKNQAQKAETQKEKIQLLGDVVKELKPTRGQKLKDYSDNQLDELAAALKRARNAEVAQSGTKLYSQTRFNQYSDLGREVVKELQSRGKISRAQDFIDTKQLSLADIKSEYSKLVGRKTAETLVRGSAPEKISEIRDAINAYINGVRQLGTAASDAVKAQRDKMRKMLADIKVAEKKIKDEAQEVSRLADRQRAVVVTRQAFEDARGGKTAKEIASLSYGEKANILYYLGQYQQAIHNIKGNARKQYEADFVSLQNFRKELSEAASAMAKDTGYLTKRETLRKDVIKFAPNAAETLQSLSDRRLKELSTAINRAIGQENVIYGTQEYDKQRVAQYESDLKRIQDEQKARAEAAKTQKSTMRIETARKVAARVQLQDPSKYATATKLQLQLLQQAVAAFKRAIAEAEGDALSILNAEYQGLLDFTNKAAEAQRAAQTDANKLKREKATKEKQKFEYKTAATFLKNAGGFDKDSYAGRSLEELEQLQAVFRAYAKGLENYLGRAKYLTSKAAEYNNERLKALGVAIREGKKQEPNYASVMLGRDAYRAAGGNVFDVKPTDRVDVSRYLNAQIDRTERLRDTLVSSGRHPETVKRLTSNLYELRQALQNVNAEVAHGNPVWHQAGILLNNFMRYAIGYTVLYKLINAIKDLAGAAVTLEDNLKGIQAITGSTSSEMVNMKKVIEEVATTSAFKLEDIAGAVRTIIQAGVDLRDVPQAIKAVSDLATASGTSLQTAADIITTAQAVWDNVSPEDIANKVTQAANVSKLAVEDLQSIFNFGASFAESANINLDQYLNLVAALRNAGRKPSTIGTGLSQLLKELFAPDDKFSNFLANQYLKIGERMSPDAARAKFSGFTDTSDPMQAALQELTRIQANSPEARMGLQRALDQRAVRALTPLLDNPQALIEIQARRSAAPTAAESAAVAMESLKKASENLRDQMEALSEKILSPLLPVLTKLVTGLGKFADILGKIIDRGEENERDRGAGILSTAATLVTGFSGAIVGAGAASKFSRNPYAKLALGAVGALFGGTGAYQMDRSAAAADSSGVSKGIFDTIVTYIASKKILGKAIDFVLGGAKSATAATSTTSTSIKWISGLALALEKYFGGAKAKLIATPAVTRLTGLLATPAAGWIGGLIKFATYAWLVWEFVSGIKKATEDAEGDLKDLKSRLTADNPTDLAMQKTEIEMENSRGNKRYGKAFSDQEAPPESYDALVEKRRKQLTLFTEQARQALGIGQETALNPQELIDALSPLLTFQGSEETRAELVRSIQQQFQGSGKVEQDNLQATQNTLTDLVTGVNSVRSALITTASELEAERVAGVLSNNPEKEKEYNALQTIRSNPMFAWFFDPSKQGDLQKTLEIIAKIAEAGRAAGIKIAEQSSKVDYETINKSIKNTAASVGTDKEQFNKDALQTYLQQGIATFSLDFADSIIKLLIESMKTAIAQNDTALGLVSVELVDTVVDSLERRAKQRQGELQRIEAFLKSWKTTGDVVSMVDPKTGKTVSVTDTAAKKIVEEWLPKAFEVAQNTLNELKRIRGLESPFERSSALAQSREDLIQGLGTPDIQVKGGLTQEEAFYNLLAKAEGATWKTIGSQVGKAPETMKDFFQFPERMKTVTGAFQFTNQTWFDPGLREKAGLKPGAAMSPENQMAMAKAIIQSVTGKENPFDQPLSEDQIVELTKQLNKRWVSLPGGKQQRFSEADVRAFWRNPQDVLGLSGSGNPLSTGIITQSKSGQLSVNEDLVRKSNIQAKGEDISDETIAFLTKQVTDREETLAKIDSEIASIRANLKLTNDRSITDVNDQIAQARLNDLQEQRQLTVNVRDDFKKRLIEKESNRLGQTAETQQQRIQEYDAEQIRKDTDLIAKTFSDQLQKAVVNQDFFTQRGLVKEELQNRIGEPGNRELLMQAEQSTAGYLQDMLRELNAKIAETEKLVKEFADKGPAGIQQFGAAKERLNQLENLRQEAKKALGGSDRTQQEYDTKVKDLQRQDLEARYAQLAQWRQALAAGGQLSEFQGDLKDIEDKILKAEEEYLQTQVTAGTITKDRLELEMARRKAAMHAAEVQATVTEALARAQFAEQGRYAFTDAQRGDQARRLGLGEALSMTEQQALAESVYRERAAALNTVTSSYYSELANSTNETLSEEERKQAKEQAIGLYAQLGELANAAGVAAARLEDLNPSILGEFGQISGASIGAKLAELPQALNKFNQNFENRIVGALDQLTSAIADAALNMLGITESMASLTTELSAIGDAKLALSDVQSQSLDIARQIEDIRRNESDPARQEYLIQRALEAQKRAEEYAQNNLDNAQKAYDQAAFDQSFEGKLVAISKELVGGVVTDLIKGTLLQGISGFFGIGQLGSTQFNPMWVKDANGGLLGSKGGVSDLIDGVKGGASPVNSGFFDWLASLFSGGSTVPGYSSDSTFMGPPAPNTGWLDSVLSIFSNLFGGGAGDSGGGIFSWITELLQGLLGGSGGGGGWLGGIMSLLKLIPMFAASGGMVKGPGTSTSDSIPAYLSNDEYVLNARTTAAIGKETLDAWNFYGKYPMKLATGGMVDGLRSSSHSINPAKANSPQANANGNDNSLRVILVDDHRRVQDFFNSPAGERTFVDFVRKNNLSLRQALQA